MRRLVALFLICLLAVPAGAQGPPAPKPVRVRITGPNTYQVPGVIEIRRDRISGRPVRLPIVSSSSTIPPTVGFSACQDRDTGSPATRGRSRMAFWSSSPTGRASICTCR